MNKLIYRKLAYDIIGFFLLSSLAITAIVWVIQGVNLLDIVSEQGHGIKVYFLYIALNIPKIFSKLLIFSYFLTLFVILSRYHENNEILVFWTNGIKKISFINFIGRLSLIFLLLQLILNLFVVPYTQNLKQKYIKNSSIEFFPNLIQEKKFSGITKNLTIFVEENKKGIFRGIYIKEKINNGESKIITASNGKLLNKDGNYSFKLLDGKITNIDNKGSFDLKFKESIYKLYKINSKTRQTNKINETKSLYLINCLKKYIKVRKDPKIRCENENSFLIKDIYEELFKRIINPVYIVILSLVSSLIILKSRINNFENYFKSILFFLGFSIIIFSELSYKFISINQKFELFIILLPILFVILFYLSLLFKSKFKFKHL